MLKTNPATRTGGKVSKLQLVISDGTSGGGGDGDGNLYEAQIFLAVGPDDGKEQVLIMSSDSKKYPELVCLEGAATELGDDEKEESGLDCVSIDIDFEDRIVSRSKVNGIFYRFHSSWSLSGDKMDELPTRAESLAVLQATLSTAGTMGALLATTAVAGFFVLALSFAAVDNPGTFKEYSTQPLFIIFLLSISASLFCALWSMTFVIQSPLNVAARMNHLINPEDTPDIMINCISYGHGNFDGSGAPVLAVD